jgi:hypothetical protein
MIASTICKTFNDRLDPKLPFQCFYQLVVSLLKWNTDAVPYDVLYVAAFFC